MINVRLPWPPTINTYYSVVNNRKVLSKKGRTYKSNGLIELMAQRCPKGVKGRVEVGIEAYPPDLRRRDLDNICKPILDLMTEYGLWDDDSQIDILRVRRREKQKPGHVRVYISEID